MTDEELIKRIAVEVMGWELLYLTENDYPSGPHWKTEESYWPLHEWNPLTNLNHAFMVVERMRELGFGFRTTIIEKNWNVIVWKLKTYTTDTDIRGESVNENLGHAICLAALKAKEEK